MLPSLLRGMLAYSIAEHKSLLKDDFLELLTNCCTFTNSCTFWFFSLRMIDFLCLSVLRCCVTLNRFSLPILTSQYLQYLQDFTVGR